MPEKKSKNRSARVARMAQRQKWKCHWCGRFMSRKPGLPSNPTGRTYDHLYSSYHPLRIKHLPGSRHNRRHDKPWAVAACWKCNNKRGRVQSLERWMLWHPPADIWTIG